MDKKLSFAEELAVSEDGSMVAGLNSGGSIYLWRPTSGLVTEVSPDEAKRVPAGMYKIAFAPDGKHLISGGSTGINIWELNPVTRLVTTLRNSKPGGIPYSLMDTSSDGRVIVAVAARKDASFQVDIWDMEDFKPKASAIIPWETEIRPRCKLTISADGSSCALADSRGRVVVVDSASGEVVSELQAAVEKRDKEMRVKQFTLSADGSFLAYCAAPASPTPAQTNLFAINRAKRTAKLLRILTHGGSSGGFSTDGRWLSVVEETMVQQFQTRIVELATGKVVATFDSCGPFFWLPDESRAFLFERYRGFHLLSVPRFVKERFVLSRSSRLAGFSTTRSKEYFVTSMDGRVELWNSNAAVSTSSPLVRETRLHEKVYGVSRLRVRFSEDGRTVLAWPNDTRECPIQIWKHSEEKLPTPPITPPRSRGIVLSDTCEVCMDTGPKSGNLFAIFHFNFVDGVREGTSAYIVFDPAKNKRMQWAVHPETRLTCLTVSSDERLVAIGVAHDAAPKNPEIRILDASTGKLIKSIRSTLVNFGHPSKVVFSPDHSKVATITSDRRVFLADVITGEEIPTTATTVGKSSVLSFADNGSTLITEFDRKICFWSVADGVLIRSVPLRKDKSYDSLETTLSPDGQRLAVGYRDGVVEVIDQASGKVINRLDVGPLNPGDQQRALDTNVNLGAGALAFSPDGKSLAVGHRNGILRVWDLGSRETSSKKQGSVSER